MRPPSTTTQPCSSTRSASTTRPPPSTRAISKQSSRAVIKLIWHAACAAEGPTYDPPEHGQLERLIRRLRRLRLAAARGTGSGSSLHVTPPAARSLGVVGLPAG
jgi:hypothetical protein